MKPHNHQSNDIFYLGGTHVAFHASKEKDNPQDNHTLDPTPLEQEWRKEKAKKGEVVLLSW